MNSFPLHASVARALLPAVLVAVRHGRAPKRCPPGLPCTGFPVYVPPAPLLYNTRLGERHLTWPLTQVGRNTSVEVRRVSFHQVLGLRHLCEFWWSTIMKSCAAACVVCWSATRSLKSVARLSTAAMPLPKLGNSSPTPS